MVEATVSILRRLLNDIEIFLDGRRIPDDTLDYFDYSLEFAYRELLFVINQSENEAQQYSTVADIIRNCLSIVRESLLQSSFHAHPCGLDQVCPLIWYGRSSTF
jgi:hypothetical protein